MKDKLHSRFMIPLAMQVIAAATCLVACAAQSSLKVPSEPNPLRAPAYPLITIDPYTSVWSMTDNLYDSPTKHWTGKNMPILGVIKVDDKFYRFMGKEPSVNSDGKKIQQYFTDAADQLSVDVQPMQTIYTFNCGMVRLTVTFTAPMFTDDLDLLSRPVNYITFQPISRDGKKHSVEFYLEASPEIALDTPDQESEAEFRRSGNLVDVSTSSRSQQILAKKGDDVRIDWGKFIMASNAKFCRSAYGSAKDLRTSFRESYIATNADDAHSKIALFKSLGNIKEGEWHALVGYDDIFSVQFFGTSLRPYWNRNDDHSIQGMFQAAESDYPKLMKAAAKFDDDLMKKCIGEGGKRYADLCALAYRQALAAQKLVQSPDGELLYLSKENFSGGLIGTVDVTYPCAPMLLYYNPKLAEAQLNPIFYYTEHGHWNKPFAPHDVGTYPIAEGQAYGDGMPVEESGNMLILCAAITKAEGNAEYARKHWAKLTEWVEYLMQFGFDPENQLCTDDFAGHLAHNANLSIKAILGIASYAYMAKILGYPADASKYKDISHVLAQKWEAAANDGDHYRLTFDQPGTWSQKYNLVWDKMIGLDTFDPTIAQKELSFYLTKMNRFGLPLDSRKTYTKTDWIIWTATMAGDRSTFEQFVSPVYDFMNETEARVPMSDWIYTDKPEHVGFRARSVVGGYFIKLLAEKMR